MAVGAAGDAIHLVPRSRTIDDQPTLDALRAGDRDRPFAPPDDGNKVDMLTILLVVLIVLVLAGGFGYGGGRYRTGGIGLGGVLLIILLILLLTGSL